MNNQYLLTLTSLDNTKETAATIINGPTLVEIMKLVNAKANGAPLLLPCPTDGAASFDTSRIRAFTDDELQEISKHIIDYNLPELADLDRGKVLLKKPFKDNFNLLPQELRRSLYDFLIEFSKHIQRHGNALKIGTNQNISIYSGQDHVLYVVLKGLNTHVEMSYMMHMKAGKAKYSKDYWYKIISVLGLNDSPSITLDKDALDILTEYFRTN